jgi:exodeoxyribonuclease-3
MRIVTCNLNGIRAAARKGFFDWLAEQAADVVCLQETRIRPGDFDLASHLPAGWRAWLACALRPGYSGVAVLSPHAPDAVIEGLGFAACDDEGRYLELRFGRLAVASLYLPSGSAGAHRQAAKFDFMARIEAHLAGMHTSGREYLLCGDWNIAHREADLRNWKGNQKNSGFLPEERAWMDALFAGQGWVDVYRRLHPDSTDECYTWWSNRGQARAKNVGWRIDYQIATPGVAAHARSARIHKQSWFSDHAPLTIDYPELWVACVEPVAAPRRATAGGTPP